MSVFNPQVAPTNDPNYLGWSKPIETPQGDTSLGVALKEGGELLTEGVHIADTYIKKTIESDLHTSIDSERAAYTEALNYAQDKVKTDKVSLLQGSGEGQSIPGGINEGLQKIDQIQGAKANGKLSETYYYGRLDTIAKDMRSRFPGYRDYIDEKVSNITGVNPANAYIKSIISDINTYQTNSNTEHNKIESQIFENIQYVGEQNWQRWKQGNLSDTAVLGMIAQRKAVKSDLELRELQRKDITGNKTLLADSTKDNATFFSANLVSDALQDVITNAGFTGQKAIDFLHDMEAGKIKIPQDKVQFIQEAFASMREKVNQRLQAEYNKQRDNGSTWAVDVGGSGVANTQIAGHIKPLDDILGWINNKDYGPAFRAENFIKATTAQTSQNILTNKDIGPYMANTAAVRHLGGDRLVQDLFEQAIKTGMGTKWTAWVSKMGTEAVAQPDFESTGYPRTISDFVADSQKVQAPKEVFQSILSLPEALSRSDVPDPVKASVARTTFDPKNRDVLNSFEVDHTDPATGRFVPGKWSIFNTFTSQAKVDEVKRLSQNDPKLLTDMQQWANTSFGTMFRQEINNLNKLQNYPGLKLAWDPDAHLFNVTFPNQDPKYSNNSYSRTIKDSIQRLNLGLQGLSNVAGAMPGAQPDVVDALLVRQLVSLGFNPTIKNVAGIPQQIMNAILSSKQEPVNYWKPTDKKTGASETNQRSNYAEDGDYTLGANGNLQDFLRHPDTATGFKLTSEAPKPSQRPSSNLSDQDIVNVDVQDIPRWMSARQYIEFLKSKNNGR